MRLAVAVPSLAADAPQGRALDAVLAQLVAAGHEVEGFAEHDRLRRPSPVPLFHYLRMAERHRAAAFDTALYPLGRDASPYQSVYTLMHRFPGVLWFLDAIVHHLALGGIALMGDWAAYRRLLDDAYGEAGAAVAQTVANNWGTGALFRRYDLVAATAARQPWVLAAWPALARRVEQRLDASAAGADGTVPGRQVGVVELGPAGAVDLGPAGEAGLGPADEAGLGSTGVIGPGPAGDAAAGEGAPSGVRHVAIMSVNESYATTAVRAAEAALMLGDDVRVTLCLSEAIYEAEGGPVAERAGIHERIDWQLTSSPRALDAVAQRADVLVWLAEELQGGHRLLLLQGLAAGKPTVVPRTDLYDDLPEGAVARLDLGTGLGPALGELLRALAANAELRAGMAAAARAFAAERSDPSAVAARLIEELDAACAAFRLREQPVAAREWSRLATAMTDAALPFGASPSTARLIEDIVRAQLDKGGAR